MFCSEYTGVVLLFSVSAVLGAALMALCFLASFTRSYDAEKLSAYECGFDPFSGCRSEFSVHFYLIGILFVVFDLEVILLFPWVLSAGTVPSFALWSSLDFLIELAAGFAYAWLSGALEV